MRVDRTARSSDEQFGMMSRVNYTTLIYAAIQPCSTVAKESLVLRPSFAPSSGQRAFTREPWLPWLECTSAERRLAQGFVACSSAQSLIDRPSRRGARGRHPLARIYLDEETNVDILRGRCRAVAVLNTTSGLNINALLQNRGQHRRFFITRGMMVAG